MDIEVFPTIEATDLDKIPEVATDYCSLAMEVSLVILTPDVAKELAADT